MLAVVNGSRGNSDDICDVRQIEGETTTTGAGAELDLRSLAQSVVGMRARSLCVDERAASQAAAAVVAAASTSASASSHPSPSQSSPPTTTATTATATATANPVGGHAAHHNHPQAGGLGRRYHRRTSTGSIPAAVRMRRRMSVTERPGCTVFLDIVEYSKASDIRQREVAQDFMRTLRSLLERAWGQPPDRVRDASKFLVLPTGDGAAICVLRAAPGHPCAEFTALWIGANLLGWARGRDGVGLRCGLNSGMLDTVEDPYGHPNVCGDAINMAARIMDCARDGQILASTYSVVPRLRCGGGASTRNLMGGGDADAGGGDVEIAGLRYRVCSTPNEIIVKHAVTTMVQSITCSLSMDLWNSVSRPMPRVGDPGCRGPKEDDNGRGENFDKTDEGRLVHDVVERFRRSRIDEGGTFHDDDGAAPSRASRIIEVGMRNKPVTKWYLKVKPTELEHDADTGMKAKVPPGELMKRHHSIAFVGVTHDQLARVFSSVLSEEPSHGWDRIYVFFLDDANLEKLSRKNGNIDTAEELMRKKRGGRASLQSLLTPHVRDLRFFEYNRPFFCASYWDWDEPGGFIHVSPLVWGADPKVCPAMDYHWNSRLPGDSYKVYRNGLTSLLLGSTVYHMESDKTCPNFRRRSDLG